MAHTHLAQDDTYYLDQLCLIGISAAFGGICLALYFGNSEMLKLILGVQFYPYVLLSGIVLMALVLVRSVALWRASGAAKQSGAHTHTHDHDHEHCDHDHDHTHDHHGHSHGHGHAHDDGHDHAWAPWRYVVLLIPVMLYCLGLPSERPGVEGGEVDTTRETIREAVQSIALANHALLPSPCPVGQLAAVAALTANSSVEGPVNGVDFKTLHSIASSPYQQERWAGKTVQVVGQFAPYPQNDRVFTLARYKIQCCGADAIQLDIPIICRESLRGFKRNDWVDVTGRIEFHERPGRAGKATYLLVSLSKNVKHTHAEPDPYIR